MANNSTSSSKNDIFEVLIYIVLFVGLSFWITSFLRTPSVFLYLKLHELYSNYPSLFFYMPSERIVFFLRQYQSVLYRSETVSVITILSSVFTFFYPIITLIMVRSFLKYKYKTLTYKQTNKFNSIDKIMEPRKQTNPSAYISYSHQRNVRDNKQYAIDGLFRLEDGPVRWLIKNHALTYKNRTLSFSKPNNDVFLKAADEYKSYSKYAGQLDIDTERVKKLLINQLGKKFEGVRGMDALRIELINVFLMYSLQKKKRKAAKTYLDSVISKVSIKYNKKTQVGNAKYTGSKKSALAKFKTLEHLIPENSYLSTHELTFILDIFNNARKVNADITAPDFNPILAVDRELFLLLHSYSGPNEKIENTAYIETYAPLALWVRFDEITSLYSIYDYRSNALGVNDSLLGVVSYLHDKKVSKIDKKLMSKISKTKHKFNKELFSLVDSYQCSDFYSLVFILIGVFMEQLDSHRIIDDIDINECDSNSSLVLSIVHFISKIGERNKLSPKQVCDRIYNKQHAIILIDEHADSSEVINSDILEITNLDIMDQKFRAVLKSISHVSSRSRVLTKDQETNLLKSTDFAIETCLKYIISYLSTSEKWLKPDYTLTYQSIINPALEMSDVEAKN